MVSRFCLQMKKNIFFNWSLKRLASNYKKMRFELLWFYTRNNNLFFIFDYHLLFPSFFYMYILFLLLCELKKTSKTKVLVTDFYCSAVLTKKNSTNNWQFYWHRKHINYRSYFPFFILIGMRKNLENFALNKFSNFIVAMLSLERVI